MSRRAIFQRLLGYLKEHRLSLFLCMLSAFQHGQGGVVSAHHIYDDLHRFFSLLGG